MTMHTTLLVKPGPPDPNGRVLHITPQSANWNYVGFSLHQLSAGQNLQEETADEEVCIVVLSGTLSARAGDRTFASIGARMDIFSGARPYALYVPNDAAWSLTALSEAQVAICRAPGRGGHSVHLIAPDDIQPQVRGSGSNTRHIHPILMEDRDGADHLLVTEVYTPAGNWSSYPPHKHDRDAFPDETCLEEIYYHRLNPPQGFAYQRVYTDDRSLDENMAVADGEVVLVPKGYHPCAAPHGYDLYYLNVMAGPRRAWRFQNDPDHDWIVNAPTARPDP